MTDSLRYDAFGNVMNRTGTTPTPFGFVGASQYQTDGDSGLQLLGHRYYDPSIGRFLSSDPAKAGTNWYAYCDNNPLRMIDPEGLDSLDDILKNPPRYPWDPPYGNGGKNPGGGKGGGTGGGKGGRPPRGKSDSGGPFVNTDADPNKNYDITTKMEATLGFRKGVVPRKPPKVRIRAGGPVVVNFLPDGSDYDIKTPMTINITGADGKPIN